MKVVGLQEGRRRERQIITNGTQAQGFFDQFAHIGRRASLEQATVSATGGMPRQRDMQLVMEQMHTGHYVNSASCGEPVARRQRARRPLAHRPRPQPSCVNVRCVRPRAVFSQWRGGVVNVET